MKFPPVPGYRCFSCPVHLTDENTFDGSILVDEPDVLRCEIRKIGKDPDLRDFERRQNYAAREPGADDLALEAELALISKLHPDYKKMRIGIPLSMVSGIADFTVEYTGAYFSLFAGDTLLDEDFPFGEPPGTPSHSCPPTVRKPSLPVRKKMSVHTWSPGGLNVWAGDVSLGVFGKEFHLFYLLDRRHHGSRFLGGAHQWGHLVTEDFRTWRDDGCLLPLTDQWQSYGTGTPFLLDGKITLAYGLHTERTLGPGKPPRGMTFAVSDDGMHFTAADFSYDDMPENPSIYNMPDGSLILYSGFGKTALKMFRAEKWPDFQLVSANVAPSGEESCMHNNLDCPAMFEWHGKYFLLLGFSAMFRGEDPAFAGRTDLASAGNDIYDGLCVPMVTNFENDRRILAGWLHLNGWGGVLGIRELVWFDDKIPGIRWLDEAMPAVAGLREEKTASAFAGGAFFEFNQSAGEDLLVHFSGTRTVKFSVDTLRRRAELVFADQEKALTLLENADTPIMQIQIQAVEKIRNLDRDYKVRIMILEEKKWNGCIVDAEIAGCRTLIHYFEGCHLIRCRVLKGGPSYLQGTPEPISKVLALDHC